MPIMGMDTIKLPLIEKRLQRRYLTLVKSHLHMAPELAAGVPSLPTVTTAFAATQAAWRFLNNDRVTLPALAEPLRDAGRTALARSHSKFALLVHDWSKLTYPTSGGKLDLVQLTHATDIGYELTTALLVRADGVPLAPMEIHLRTKQGLLSTRPDARQEGHLEQVLPTMKASKTWQLDKPLLHVIDREADSVDHYRRWDAAGHKFLVRADDRRVKHAKKSRRLSDLANQVYAEEKFQAAGEAAYQGKSGTLWVAELEVTLDRPAKKKIDGKSVSKPGKALRLRYVIAEVRDESGKTLARWMLLSNAPQSWATTEELARGYYYRWQIESFFKLLKSHGSQLENWQQETGVAIARRLLVAAMACVLVWQLQADESKEGKEFRDVLVRLSGRQTKRKKPHTAPALLAGVWILISMLTLLDHYNLHNLRQLACKFIPLLSTA